MAATEAAAERRRKSRRFIALDSTTRCSPRQISAASFNLLQGVGYSFTMPPGHTPLHWVNIAIHVVFGAAALALGLVAICSPKGRRLHIGSGRLFIYAYLVVITTATIGLLAFDFRSFLAV